MYIIDFDDTLFDTNRFKQARFESLQELGVSKELYKETYQTAYKDENGKFAYTNERHADALGKKGVDRDKALAALETTTGKSIKNFLFSDAISFLEYLDTKGELMILLSLGDAAWQDLKVTGSGIQKYFNQIYYVDETKEHILRDLFNKKKEEDAILINDKIAESKQLQKNFQKMQIILKKSASIPESDYQTSELKYFNNLREIKEYVGSKLG